jgi:DNA-binding protein HU-beta
MNKTDLVKKVAEAASLTNAQAKEAVDAFTTAVKEALVSGDKVQLVGFGTFSIKKREARKGVNPSNGQKIDIPAKNLVKFSAGAEFEGAVNK